MKATEILNKILENSKELSFYDFVINENVLYFRNLTKVDKLVKHLEKVKINLSISNCQAPFIIQENDKEFKPNILKIINND